MLTKFSTPINELPSFLSTISMVGDDQSAIIQKLRDAERKSPSGYGPTRDLFLTILQGKLSFEKAMDQAWLIKDDTERKCATQVLETSKQFLLGQHPARIAPLLGLNFSLPNGLSLAVSPVWIRQSDQTRLLVLHFWQSAFTQWQLAAAAAILRSSLMRQKHEYASCEIDLISVPFFELINGRRFEIYNWAKLKPLDDTGLNRFLDRLVSAWNEYKKHSPREVKARHSRTLFD